MLPTNNNDTFVDSYMKKLVSRGALFFRGCFFLEFVVMPISLNLIVKVVLEELHKVIIKIRDSVK